MGYLDVSPGVGMRHLKRPKNPAGLNLGMYLFVFVYKVHMCIYMLGGGMRSWTNYFFLQQKSSSEKETQKMWTQTTDHLKSLMIKIWGHRPSIKGTNPLFIVIKAIIVIRKRRLLGRVGVYLSPRKPATLGGCQITKSQDPLGWVWCLVSWPVKSQRSFWMTSWTEREPLKPCCEDSSTAYFSVRLRILLVMITLMS